MSKSKAPVEKSGRRQCFHCKEWIPAGAKHDCWTTTEQALTKDLPEDLRDAWERLRETAAEFGEQRIYASHSSIMFSRRVCYFFVRPMMKRLEVCVFLGRALKTPLVKKVVKTSRAKVAHILHVTHRDQVEAPLTDWLKEAYDVSPTLSRTERSTSGKPVRPPSQRGIARTSRSAEHRTSPRRKGTGPAG